MNPPSRGHGEPVDALAELVRQLEAPWRADALCREPQYRHVDFFPGRGRDTATSKAVCARCLVAAECLADAIAHGDLGVRGATTKAERDRLTGRRSRPRVA